MAFFEGSLIPALDDNGNPISGAKWKFFAAGTTTPLRVYSDVGLTTAVGSSVTADSGGAFGPIYYESAIPTRARMETAAGALIRDYDIDLTVRSTLVPYSPEQFGAIGDGVANDQPAFDLLAAAINEAGGGSIQFKQGATYLIGKQSLGGGVFYLTPGSGLYIHDCTETVTLDFNGANFKMNPMKFGTFDKVTGAPYSPALPFYDYSYRADPGSMFKFENNARVVLTGGADMDVNGPGMTIGGAWGDVGYQIIMYGIEAYSNDYFNTDGCNVKIRNSLLDGLAVGSTGLTATSAREPFVLRGIHVENVGRNNISVVGSNDLLIDKCSFVNPGRGPLPGGTYLTSAPGSAIDIEAESSVNRNVRVTNTVIIEGPTGGAAIVADSGDSRDLYFENCLIDGRISISRQGTLFRDCIINGKFTKVGSGAKGNATEIIDCRGSDTPIYSTAVTGNFIDAEGSGAGAIMKGCAFTLSNLVLNGRGLTVEDSTISFAHVPAKVANRSTVAFFDSPASTLRRTNFTDALSGYTAGEGLSILTDNATVDACNITYVAGLLKWNSWSNGGGGYPRSGRTDGRHDRAAPSVQALRIQREANFGGGENEWATVQALSASPSPTGLKGGSFVFNTGAANGGIGGWILDSGGTFRACGIVGAVQSASVAFAAGANPTKAEFDALISALKTANLMA